MFNKGDVVRFIGGSGEDKYKYLGTVTRSERDPAGLVYVRFEADNHPRHPKGTDFGEGNYRINDLILEVPPTKEEMDKRREEQICKKVIQLKIRAEKRKVKKECQISWGMNPVLAAGLATILGDT